MANGTSVPMQTPRHLPVMWKEVMDGLHVKPDGRYLDGTFGRGGHARAQGQIAVVDAQHGGIGHYAVFGFGRVAHRHRLAIDRHADGAGRVRAGAVWQTLANADVSAGFGLQHERKILAAHAGQHVAPDLVLAHQGGGYIACKHRLVHGVHRGGVSAFVKQFG